MAYFIGRELEKYEKTSFKPVLRPKALTVLDENVKMGKIEEVLYLPAVQFPRSVGNRRGLSCFMDEGCGLLNVVYCRGRV
jgi:hypothetical protein